MLSPGGDNKVIISQLIRGLFTFKSEGILYLHFIYNHKGVNQIY